MQIFPQVDKLLRKDDGILAMSDTEFLEVELSEALWWEHRVVDLMPYKLLPRAVSFAHQLAQFAQHLAGEPSLPDPRNPNSFCRFKKGKDKEGKDVVVAFHGDSPVWYWHRVDDGPWKLHMMRVTRKSHLTDTDDIDAWLTELENLNADARDGNDPERLAPDPLIAIIAHFVRVLGRAEAQLDGAPWLPDAMNPNGKCRFKSNDKFILAYRASQKWNLTSQKANWMPIWCWRRKPDGNWKLYRLRTGARAAIPEPSLEHRLGVGNWN